ncbi:MAG: hypothetical protein K2Q18_04845 [Bdellovibrionales bacterium]|nr:hypothetical protein [Bdellovibrionales bacterium]
MLKKSILFFLLFTLAQLSYAADFAYGEKVQLENGNVAEVQFKLNNDGTYNAYIRELKNSSVVVCESRVNSYWNLQGRILLLSGLGIAESVTCGGTLCFSVEFGKNIALVGDETIVLPPISRANVKETPSVPSCRKR